MICASGTAVHLSCAAAVDSWRCCWAGPSVAARLCAAAVSADHAAPQGENRSDDEGQLVGAGCVQVRCDTLYHLCDHLSVQVGCSLCFVGNNSSAQRAALCFAPQLSGGSGAAAPPGRTPQAHHRRQTRSSVRISVGWAIPRRERAAAARVRPHRRGGRDDGGHQVTRWPQPPRRL